MYNNIINGTDELRRRDAAVAPVITNASPPMINTAKQTIQNICSLFEEILLLILAIDS
jgi:hypothetical protein